MEDSLLSWLDNAHVMIMGRSDFSDVELKLARVGAHIFGLGSNSCDLKCVQNELCRHFGSTGLTETLLRGAITVTIEACLCVAMSDDCVDRPSFVQGIMNMSADDRVNLMQAIKNNMSDFMSDDDQNEDDMQDYVQITNTSISDEVVMRIVDDKDEQDESFDCDETLPMDATLPLCDNNDSNLDLDVEEGGMIFSQELSNSAHALMDPIQEHQEEQAPSSRIAFSEKSSIETGAYRGAFAGKCRPCLEKDVALKQLSVDLEAALAKAHETEIRLKGEIAIEKNKLVDSELQVIEREEQLGKKDQEIREAKKKITDLEWQLSSQKDCQSELYKLQDELDILRPKAEKADQTEVQIDRLRSRLEELVDVKQQLKSEAAAHSETYSRLIACETEIESLVACKKQLDEYRVNYTESLLQVDELSRKLQQREQEVACYVKDNISLGASSGASLKQTQHLAQELKATAEHLRQVERSNGIGEGMSEFNPAIMQELTKLRKDNLEMAGKLDASSLDSLARLEKELADQRCMVSSLQQKLMDTKDSLALALSTIIHLNDRIAMLDNEKICMLRETAENSIMYSEERNILMQNRSRAEQNSRKRRHHAISLVQTGSAAVTFELSHELHTTSNKLTSTTQELLMLSNDKSKLDEEYSSCTIELQKAHSDMALLVEEYEVKVNDLLSTHSSAMEQEIARYRDLEVDLEEERHKRRKVEREKKFFESEAKSNKNQLLAAGSSGSSGVEVEAALKELKTMQHALDAAQAEIATLRASAGGGGGKCGGSSDLQLDSSSGSLRPQRVKTSALDRDPAAGNSSSGTSYTSYFEQADLVDKRLEHADKERRQLIAKNLEESKEKMELQQKLLRSEKEVAALKRERTKLTLEKERLHSQLSKAGEEPESVNDENAGVNSPMSAAPRARRSRAL